MAAAMAAAFTSAEAPVRYPAAMAVNQTAPRAATGGRRRPSRPLIQSARSAAVDRRPKPFESSEAAEAKPPTTKNNGMTWKIQVA